MIKSMEKQPVIVPDRAIQAGEIRDRWSWVEPLVWTKRMLTALEKGVKGGKWYSLIDKVYEKVNLFKAFDKVKANKGKPGVDHQTIEMFEERLEDNLDRLQQEIKNGTYRPRAIHRVWMPKPGRKEKRPLGIPTVRDRVVQTALRNVIEPIFEETFARQSYGFRPERGCKDALRQVSEFLAKGQRYVVDADLKGYFDNIDKPGVMRRVSEKISDTRVLELIEMYLNQEVMDGLERWTPETGTPQGAVISPLLANIYLNELDHKMAAKGYSMVRYADDFVVLCTDKATAGKALNQIQSWVFANRLELHPEKTKITNVDDPGGFEFLGYRFEKNMRFPRNKSLKKLKDTIRGKTKRNNGQSLQAIIEDVNQTLRGWFEYYKHANKWTFPRLDGWIRMRLRSILRKRRKGRGRGRGSDHHRWKNAFFAARGLFSLVTAHRAASQSVTR